jgi:hypothetical protein
VRKPFIIAALALGLFACKNESATETPEEGSSIAHGQPVKEVVKDPEYGERVTVDGKVDHVYGPQVFTMKAPIFQDDLLVVAPKELVAEALAAPEEVEVVGTVRKMIVSEVEREFAIDFDNAVEVKWEERPFLVAESLTRLQKDAEHVSEVQEEAQEDAERDAKKEERQEDRQERKEDRQD